MVLIIGFALLAAVLIMLHIRLNYSFLRQGPIGDAVTHYNVINRLRQDKTDGPNPQYLMNNFKVRYPRLFHRCCARLFSAKLLFEHQYIPSAFMFVISSMVLNMFVLEYGYLIDIRFDLTTLLLVNTLFLSSLMNNVYDDHTIHYLILSERYFSKIICAAYFLSLYFLNIHLSAALLIQTIILAILGLNSSRFARQPLLLMSPLYALLTFNMVMLVPILVGFVLNTILFKRKFIEDLIKQVAHLQSWFKYNPCYETKLSTVLTLKYLKNNTLYQIIRSVFHGNVKTIINYPEYVVMIALFLLSATKTACISIILLPFIALGMFFLTVLRKYCFIGDGQRYISYSLYFYFPLSLLQMQEHVSNLTFKICIGSLLAYNLAKTIFTYIKSTYRNKYHDELSPFLDGVSFSAQDVLYAINFRLGEDVIARGQPCKIFMVQAGNMGKDEANKFFERYPYLKKNWNKIFAEYDVSYVIVNVKEIADLAWEYAFESLDKVKENGTFQLYKVKM